LCGCRLTATKRYVVLKPVRSDIKRGAKVAIDFGKGKKELRKNNKNGWV
jgi:hypothetical protein